MTETQKDKIKNMRMKGLGYGTIARELGLKSETVKSHCRRNGMAAKDKKRMTQLAESGIRYCRNCGTEVPQNSKRKPKVFCCDTCRQRWWNAHADQINRKAIYKIKCLNCGKEFEVYGNKHRKYCCHECYIQHRFGVQA